MSSQTIKYTYSSNERTSFRMMAVSVFLGLFSQVFQNDIGASLLLVISFAILIIGVFGICLFFMGVEKRGVFVSSFLTLIIYFLLVGLITGNHSYLAIALVQDLRYVMYFLMGAIFALDERYMAYFHSILVKVGAVAVLLGIYALLTFPFGSIELRESVWTKQYFFWWASCSSFLYLGAYALITKKNRIVGYGTFALYFILGSLFLKRSTLVDAIVLIALSVIVNTKKPFKNTLFVLGGVVAALFLLQRIVPEYFAVTSDALMNRFDTIENVSEVDRNIESQLFFDRAPLINIILGYGIFNYPTDILLDARPLNALHNGWANIIFKGGVLYAFWYIWAYLRVFGNIRRLKRTDDLTRVCIVVALASLVSLLFEGGWTYTILPFCISAPFFYAARKIS